jgi:TatD DNase family protein
MPEHATFLIDYHCHLDLYPDYQKQYKLCSKNNIAALTVTTTPRAWARNIELAANCPNVRVGLGIHPQIIETGKTELPLFEKLLPDAKYVGEVGLDAGPNHYKTYPQQRETFDIILRLCNEAGHKILTVHSVRAMPDTLQLIETHIAGTTNKVVLHWFSGTPTEARKAAQLGCYFSINIAMLNRPITPALIASIPSTRLLTETDGPFTMAHGRPALPSDVSSTVEALAAALKLNIQAAKQMLCTNLAKLEETKLE